MMRAARPDRGQALPSPDDDANPGLGAAAAANLSKVAGP